jgi:hypothetical protein
MSTQRAANVAASTPTISLFKLRLRLPSLSIVRVMGFIAFCSRRQYAREARNVDRNRGTA